MAGGREPGMFGGGRRLLRKGHGRWAAIPFAVYILFFVSVIGVASLEASGQYDVGAVDLRQHLQAPSAIIDITDPYSHRPALSTAIYLFEINPLDQLRSGFYHHGNMHGYFTTRMPGTLFAGGSPCQGIGCFYCQVRR